ncbi:uncharacterized protein LOC122854520 [Aphidius gifuensis]|uniref:uncharacterized protein LOC122854520 n=1 Tax=Aphidius gifuensis TaxID=684658 RepID=UPI001CDC354E|nr:uncharacterized protein LOC122854520 [Aphidius gifuensis]
MMKNQINIVVVQLLFIVDICFGSVFESHENGISLGEISLEKYSHHLPAITLEHSEHEIEIENWPVASFGLKEISNVPWDYKIKIPKKNQDRVIPVVEEIGEPLVEEVPIKITNPIVKTVAQPYPIFVPVIQPIPYKIIKTVYNKVEKKIPTPIEKIIPIPIVKNVPYTVQRNIPVNVIKHVPIKLPTYKTIIHKSY